MTPALHVSLIRNQFAIECGGVLLDPTTNEVCLLFYPDTSEWRLPIGHPDAMSTDSHPHTVAGCEPYAHAAQRQLTAITGYKCSHLHPAVLAHAPANPCAYIGSHMVEPLALSIQHRTTPMHFVASSGTDEDEALVPPVSRSLSMGGMRADALSSGFRHATSMSALRHSSDPTHATMHGQYVMTYYYMAWLTQSRTDPRLPEDSASSKTTVDSRPGSHTKLSAEVTWFKMDTAAQVLTHDSDKTALSEAISRLAHSAPPLPPFTYSSVIMAQNDSAILKPALKPKNPNDLSVLSTPSPVSRCPSSTGSEESAKTEVAGSLSRVLTPTRNLDLVRKAANTLSKRGGGGLLMKPKQRSVSQTTAAVGNGDAKSGGAAVGKKSADLKFASVRATGGSPAAEEKSGEEVVVVKKSSLPRVLSIFYKLVGSSTA